MAAKTTSIALGPDLAAYARRKVDSGEFGSTSEVIRDALRRAQEHDLRLQALRQAIQQGVDSGLGEPWDFEAFRQEMRLKYQGAA